MFDTAKAAWPHMTGVERFFTCLLYPLLVPAWGVIWLTVHIIPRTWNKIYSRKVSE